MSTSEEEDECLRFFGVECFGCKEGSIPTRLPAVAMVKVTTGRDASDAPAVVVSVVVVVVVVLVVAVLFKRVAILLLGEEEEDWSNSTCVGGVRVANTMLDEVRPCESAVFPLAAVVAAAVLL